VPRTAGGVERTRAASRPGWSHGPRRACRDGDPGVCGRAAGVARRERLTARLLQTEISVTKLEPLPDRIVRIHRIDVQARTTRARRIQVNSALCNERPLLA